MKDEPSAAPSGDSRRRARPDRRPLQQPQPAQPPGDYPVARPYIAPAHPAGTGRPVTSPASRARPPRLPTKPASWHVSRFLAATILKGLALGVLAIACMWIGLLLFRARAQKPDTENHALASVTVPAAAQADAANRPEHRALDSASPSTRSGSITANPSADMANIPPIKAPEPVAHTDLNGTFEKDVQPILSARCVACHGAQRKRGGLDVSTVAALLKGGKGGPSLVPGEPGASSLWEVIEANRMPPGRSNKLSPAEKMIIQSWIAHARPGQP